MRIQRIVDKLNRNHKAILLYRMGCCLSDKKNKRIDNEYYVDVNGKLRVER